MKFLIMTRLTEIYSSQRLVQELTARKHAETCVNPEYAWDGLEENAPDVVIPRLGSFRYAESMANFFLLQRRFPSAKILNDPANFHRARHKLEAHRALGDLPQPKLFATAPGSFPFIVKDCVSSQGEGVFLCRNAAELEACLRNLQGREVLFQEFVQESAGHDVRAFVVGNRVVAAMERESKDKSKEFRANLSLGGSARSVTLPKAEEELSVAAVQRLGLHYAGVDFIRSARGPLLLEINPCPGLEGIEKCSNVNVAREIVLYAESLFTARPER